MNHDKLLYLCYDMKDPSQLKSDAENVVRTINLSDLLPVSCLSENTVSQLAVPTSLRAIVEVVESVESLSPAKVSDTGSR